MAEYEVWLTHIIKESGVTFVQAESAEEARSKVEKAIEEGEDEIEWGHDPDEIDSAQIVEVYLDLVLQD